MLKTALTEDVKDYGKGLGAGLVGGADPERFHGAPPGHRPQDILPGCRSVVVYAFPMLQSTFVSPNPRVWVHRYWQLRSRLQDLGYDICRYLEEEKGFYAVNLPSTAPQEVNTQTRLLMGDLSFRHAAVMAGLGEIGLNQLLVTPQYGPRVWLQAVITTA